MLNHQRVQWNTNQPVGKEPKKFTKDDLPPELRRCWDIVSDEARYEEWCKAVDQGPASIFLRAPRMNRCKEAILRYLKSSDRRFLQKEFEETLKGAQWNFAATEIRQSLAELRKQSLIDNNQTEDPPGYGLTAGGKKFADDLANGVSGSAAD